MSLPPVRLPSGNPLRIRTACRDAARKAGWTLAAWDDFTRAFRECFQPEAQAGEHEAAMRVVRAHFAVTLGSRFSADPAQWRGEVKSDATATANNSE